MATERKIKTIDELCHFTDKQKLATMTADRYKYTLFGGARGPGKSYWLRWYCLRFLLTCASYGLKNVTVALFCENYPTLVDRHVSKIRSEFPAALGVVAERKSSHGLAFYLRPEYGSGVILLRNLDEGNIERYQSAEFALVAIDELTKNDVKVFDVLRGSLRWPGIQETRFIAATNPNGIGNNWVKNYFVDNIYPEEMRSLADKFRFVPALPTDNPHLPESYWEELKALPHHLRKAWLEGAWDAVEGTAFPEFFDRVHVISSKGFKVPGDVERYCSVDFGYEAPSSILWYYVDFDGTIFVYRELYTGDPTKPNKGLRINAYELGCMAREMEGNERINYRVCDSACWAKTGVSDRNGVPRSIADELYEADFDVIKSAKDRMQMKHQVHLRLKGYAETEDGVPTDPALFILDCCPNLIRTLKTITLDEKDIEKVSTKGDDHSFDSLGYFLMTRPFEPVPYTPDKPKDRYERQDKRRGKSWMSA
ncbi:MAG: terminase family protein [Negativicutes bacterium]|nr:terminase family protein [Negativicutes bacterium]